MGTLAAAGTSNSKSSTEPPDASASSRNRIANCPILISSLLGVVTMPTPPLLVFSVLRLIDLSSTSFLYLLSWAGLVSPAYSYVHLDYDGSRQGAHDTFASFFYFFVEVSRTSGSMFSTLCYLLSLRRLILGNPDSYTRIPIRYRGVGKRACSASFREELFSEARRTSVGRFPTPRYRRLVRPWEIS